MTRPPVRWADSDLPEELSRVVASGGPSQHDDAALARMRERLHASLGPTFESRLSGSSTSSHVLSLLNRSKWLCAAALASAGLSFLSVHSSQRPAREAPPLSAAAGAPLSTDGAPSVAASEPPDKGAAADLLDKHAALSVAEDHASQTAPAAAGGSARGRAEKHTGSSAAAAAAHAHPDKHHAPPLAADEATDAALTSAGARPANQAAHGKNAAPASIAADSGSPAPSGLAAELQGLAEIRRLLQTAPKRALDEAEAQETRFVSGALGPERELLRIEALLRAGRAEEAKHRARRALSASNNPPYRARIEKLFAQEPAVRLAGDGVAKPGARD